MQLFSTHSFIKPWKTIYNHIFREKILSLITWKPETFIVWHVQSKINTNNGITNSMCMTPHALNCYWLTADHLGYQSNREDQAVSRHTNNSKQPQWAWLQSFCQTKAYSQTFTFNRAWQSVQKAGIYLFIAQKFMLFVFWVWMQVATWDG